MAVAFGARDSRMTEQEVCPRFSIFQATPKGSNLCSSPNLLELKDPRMVSCSNSQNTRAKLRSCRSRQHCARSGQFGHAFPALCGAHCEMECCSPQSVPFPPTAQSDFSWAEA